MCLGLGGTLADNTHRRHHVQGESKDWDAFFEACNEDLPIRQTLWLLYVLLERPYHKVEIWSGRSEGEGGSVRRKTEEWIRLHCFFIPGNEPELRMRPHGDYTPDEELKRRWLHEARAAGRAPDIVFDDRAKVVAMWREEGVFCAQVAPGDF